MSRSLTAMGERFDMVSQHVLTPVVGRHFHDEWQTVGGKQLDFTLHAPATALFTYGLPVTQVRPSRNSNNSSLPRDDKFNNAFQCM